MKLLISIPPNKPFGAYRAGATVTTTPFSLLVQKPLTLTFDLFDGANRVLPMFNERVSERVARRLRALGVNIFVNRPMVKEEAEQIVLRGLQTRTETVIWTAGVKPNSFFQKISGLVFDQRSQVYC